MAKDKASNPQTDLDKVDQMMSQLNQPPAEGESQPPPEGQAPQGGDPNSEASKGPSAKDMAAAEELAAAEAAKTVAAQQENPEPVSLANVAARGMDHLHAQLRKHRADAAARKTAYTPPPLTERQLTALEAEQAAGRRNVERNREQLANRPQVKADVRKEGYSTKVARPGDFVPGLNSKDPAIR